MAFDRLPPQIIGIILKIVSTLAFTAMATLIKLLSDRFPVGEIAFFRSFFALIPVFVWVIYRGSLPTVFHTRQLPRHLLRSAVGTGAMFCGFTGLSLLPIADATAIGYASPLLTVLLAVLLLGEKVRVYRWSAVVIGLVGVLIILSGYLGGDSGGSGIGAGALFALAGAALAAFATIQSRILVKTDAAATVVAFFSLSVAVAMLATLPFGWVMPNLAELGLLVLTGIFGGLGQVFLTTSFRFGDASTIAPFDYMSMIWALIVSVFVFGTWPTATILIGAAIVISAGLFVIFREHSLGIERADSKRVKTPTSPLS
jgi:drug/metabolite transporter (DMT)-like permease